jgi:hypothetical protein
MSNQNVSRPGLKAGRSNEFTLIMPLKPGGAERLRKKLGPDKFPGGWALDRLGTVHDLRFAIFDDDTRLLFASTFDGDWDAYINDFVGLIPDVIEAVFGEVEDFHGVHSPNFKDDIVKYQIPSLYFYSAYPDASVRDVWKAMKIKGGLDVILDEATS